MHFFVGDLDTERGGSPSHIYFATPSERMRGKTNSSVAPEVFGRLSQMHDVADWKWIAFVEIYCQGGV